MMEVPQLHGFGPAANRLLEAYNTLLKVYLVCGFRVYQKLSIDPLYIIVFPKKALSFSQVYHVLVPSEMQTSY